MELIDGYWTAIHHFSFFNNGETEKLISYSIQVLSALGTLLAAAFAAISARASKEISEQTRYDFENRREENASQQVREIFKAKSEIVGLYNNLIALFAAKSIETTMYVSDVSTNDAIKYDGYGSFTQDRMNALANLREAAKNYENLAQEADLGNELKDFWSMVDIHNLRIKIHTMELKGSQLESRIAVAKYIIEKTSNYGVKNQ